MALVFRQVIALAEVMRSFPIFTWQRTTSVTPGTGDIHPPLVSLGKVCRKNTHTYTKTNFSKGIMTSMLIWKHDLLGLVSEMCSTELFIYSF